VLTSCQRVFWSGVVWSPSLTIIFLPDRMAAVSVLQGPPIAMLGLSWLVALGAAGWSQRHARRPMARLMTPRALRQHAPFMPSPAEIRTALEDALQDDALRLVVTRICRSWGRPRLNDLSPDELRELWQLLQLVTAPPDRAGALAQRFANPAVVLDIRDHLAAYRPAPTADHAA